MRDAVGKLKVKTRRYLAGEHDASLDRAEWEALPLTRLQYRPNDANTIQLLRVLFVVLVPFAQNCRIIFG